GERGLSQARRSAQQDVVRRGAPAQRRGQQQLELFADPVLGDELGQPPRPYARLRVLLPLGGLGGDQRHRVVVLTTGHRALPSSRIACLSRAGTGGVSPPACATCSATSATARSAWAADQPRPTRPARTGSRQASPGVAGAAGPAVATGPIRSRSSSTIRSAPLRPMPGTCVSTAISPLAIALRTTSGGWTASTAWASRGPTPLAVCNSSNRSRAASSANPYRVSESSRTTRLVDSRAGWPTRSSASVAGAQFRRNPTPATSTTAPSPPTSVTTPRRLAIMLSPPSRLRR